MTRHCWFLLFLIVLVTSCDQRKRLYDETHVFQDETWGKDEMPIFRVNVQDTYSPHRFFFTLRNGGQYPFSNLYLFLTTQYPDSSMAVDTIELLLSDPAGRWLGEGSGDVYENKVLFKDRVQFPDTGTYVFAIRQGMRMDELPHILDFGLRIELQ